MIKKIGLSWMLIGSLLLAGKVTEIKFEGLAHLSNSVALEIADIRVGDNMDSEKINESIKNFYAQGYFMDVWVDQQGGALIYHFDEKRSIANIEVKGYGEDGDKLLAGIGLEKGDLYDKSRIKKAKKMMIASLESQGSYDSIIDVTTTPVGKTAVSIVFTVNKGEKIKIKRLNFIGASEMGKSDLEADLVNQEEDFLGWIPFYFNNGEVKVDQLEYDTYRVKETYMKNGYLDAVVSKPLMRVDYSSYSAEVDYQIKEGVQYSVGEVSLSQDVEGLNSEELLDNLTLIKGRIFDITRMRKDMKMLEAAVGDLGYAYAKVSPQMHKNPEQGTIDLQYIIQPGLKVTINDVLIAGNDITKDRVIRRYVYLAPGDMYSTTDLEDSKGALSRTGFFDKVDIQSQRVTDTTINLIVKVKEASTGTISAGGGYGSYEGLMVNASVSDKNIFGTGINSTLGFELSKISQNYNLGFINPKVWDSMYSLGINFYKKDYEYIDYTQNQLGANINVGRQFLRHLYASVGVGYTDNDSDYDDDYIFDPLDPLSTFYDDQYSKVSFFSSVSFDNTDDYYQPRKGYIAGLNLEYSQMSGGMDPENIRRGFTRYDDFIKVTARAGAFYGLEDLLDYDLILRVKGRYANIASQNNEYMPIAERLFMGGIGSVRGYDPYSISPEVLGDRIGGTEQASGTVEASIPLSEAAKMRLAFFYDYGMITSDNVPTATGIDIKFDNITRSSVGVVLEWQSAFGPINLVFAEALDDEDNDQTAVFEFSMGTKF